MALSIKSDEADILAREVASLTGESLTEAVTEALRLRLRALRRGSVKTRLMAIAAEGRTLPRLDTRTEEEILGFDSEPSRP
ncbi:MAG: type II toxin-antitoxin system VapB family antitoxin [Candidatus Nanopelagicales bacterium]|jgi:antitoxin VapB|nr:type II toxin-antitoxin system VapB family antitoxin [Candidatus Nanopelagicales bacterium]MCU0296347.1 type II toxin-antitoxin system VapB family antitoxin [Candidatus Nanopelagicales bacterium]